MSSELQGDHALTLSANQDNEEVVVDNATEKVDRAKANADLLAKVGKIIIGDAKPSESQPKHSDKDDKDSLVEDVEVEKPVDLDQAIKDRALAAGISGELAERLHQSGLLEESLAAMDRHAIGRQAEKSVEEKLPQPNKAEKKAKAQDVADGEDVPPLDETEFDDALVKRDRFLQQRIEWLESQIANMQQRGDSVVDHWLDGSLAEIGNDDLFGKGPITSLPKDGAHAQNRVKLRDGYQKICEAYGVSPEDCSVQFLKRAYSAVFYDQVFKAAQRDTVRKLRDAEGKFINPARSTSDGLPSMKRQTPADRHNELLKKVSDICSRKA